MDIEEKGALLAIGGIIFITLVAINFVYQVYKSAQMYVG